MPPSMITAFPFAIGPVILISAVGLLLLTINNRLTQSVTRARMLCTELARDVNGYDVRRKQLLIIARRARLLRLCIEWLVASAVFSCLLVIVLFLQALYGIDQVVIPGMLFVGSLGCMVIGLVVFIIEVRQALAALELEISLNVPSSIE